MAERRGSEQGRPTIRTYRPSDRETCVRMSVEAWPKMSSGLPSGTAPDFWGMLLDLAYDYSDVREVACISESVIGVLFGRRRGRPKMHETISQVRTFLSAMLGMARKTKLRDAISMFCTLLLSEVKIMFNTPPSDGEVTFFVVDVGHQGRGVGSILLDDYLSQAKAVDVRTVSLYTTDPGCNWSFYERHGFRRVAQFGDDFGTRVEGEPSRGLMYLLDMGNSKE